MHNRLVDLYPRLDIGIFSNLPSCSIEFRGVGFRIRAG
jgi:hypothetical protein